MDAPEQCVAVRPVPESELPRRELSSDLDSERCHALMVEYGVGEKEKKLAGGVLKAALQDTDPKVSLVGVKLLLEMEAAEQRRMEFQDKVMRLDRGMPTENIGTPGELEMRLDMIRKQLGGSNGG